MGAALTVLVVVTIGFVIVRVATSALVLTGMSREMARFQARSAFFGVGFTTTEAEPVVSHPVRRRIVMWLMWLGNAGIVSVVGTLVLSFGGGHSQLQKVAIIGGGLLALFLLARTRVVDRLLSGAIERLLERFTDLEARDYAGLLHVRGGYSIDELLVQEGDWVAGRSLGELHLRDEGVVVLGVDRRGGEYVGVPHGDTVIEPGDTLVLYGRSRRIAELDDRRRAGGDAAHAEAVADEATRTTVAPA
jgi:hypothetical protein